MSANWAPPPPKIDMVGTVTYRCDACGEMIEGEHQLAPLDADGRTTRETRSYHPEHVPEPED